MNSAVIIGAATGIGAGIAEALAARGCAVLLADIDLAAAEARAAALRANGAVAHAAFADHADQASLDQLADQAFEKFGALDLVVANAGVGAGGPLYSTPQRNVDWVLAVNLVGPTNVARAFQPRMILAGQPARFALTASEHALGLPPRGGQASIYTVSKHGALAVAETLRRDLEGTQVSVSVVFPGIVATEIWNPLRTRHERFGGPRELDPARRPDPARGLTPAEAAERILAGFDAGEFFVFTHGRDIAEVHERRAREIEAALQRFAARYGDGA